MPRKSRRVWGASTAALVIAAGVTTLPAAPAQADNTISAADQPYFAYYHLDQARAKGYTGKGVTIAMIDGPVEAAATELTGASIEERETCTIDSSLASKSHGTSVASVLVSGSYGVAPEATLLTYRTGSKQDGDQPSSDCLDEGKHLKYGYAWLLNAAVNDGAQIINVSSSSTSQEDSLKWAIARSIAQGSIITASAGNGGADDNATSLSQWSGVVGVTAIGIDGNRQDYSSWGQGVTTTAVGGPVKTHDFATNQIVESSGTSFSSPIVAGVLALAHQKWPSATSNQLLQLLVKTGLNPDHTWNQYTGYGGIDPGAILNTDPTTLPDVNPLADKGNGSSPTPDEVQQYADGVVSPLQIVNDNSYSYRGFDESLITDPLVTVPTHLGTSPRYHAK
ncbi:MAG: S8 family serine peptidase [Schaalia odontolytica]|nr:S8 family serine peptidase [Schaalia odontolytica]MDU5762522.1 S8 family serine peptidase [Schaalia odontolytica]